MSDGIKKVPTRFETRSSYVGMSAGYRDPGSRSECFIIAPSFKELEEFWDKISDERIDISSVKEVVVSEA